MDFEDTSEVLEYRPETGKLLWKVASRNRMVKPGDEAGFLSAYGYRQVRVFGATRLAHRVCWLLYYGAWPDGEIDHINRVRTDNRINNLRVAPKSINQQNKRAAQRNSASGILGVTQLSSGRWRASIRANGKDHHIGTFATSLEAGEAYMSAKAVLHPGA